MSAVRLTAAMLAAAALATGGCYHALYGLLGSAYGNPAAGDAERFSEYQSKIEAHEGYERYGTRPTAAIP